MPNNVDDGNGEPLPPSWTIGGKRIRQLESRYYPGYIDEHLLFDRLISAYFRPGDAVLDAGAGRGLRYPHNLKEHAARVVGADVDPGVGENPNVTEAVVADLAGLPFPDSTFDLVISKYVFEHLAAPLSTMVELRRVMKPGGHLLIHTPNRWHYVAMAARLTPARFHVWFNDRRGREALDTFPTLYRANDRRTLTRLAAQSGFQIKRFRAIETKPDYLFFSPVAYRLGVAYERGVNRWPALSAVRVQLLVAMRAVGRETDVTTRP